MKCLLILVKEKNPISGRILNRRREMPNLFSTCVWYSYSDTRLGLTVWNSSAKKAPILNHYIWFYLTNTSSLVSKITVSIVMIVSLLVTPATKSSKSKPPEGNLILRTTVVAQIIAFIGFSIPSKSCSKRITAPVLHPIRRNFNRGQNQACLFSKKKKSWGQAQKEHHIIGTRKIETSKGSRNIHNKYRVGAEEHI